MAWPAPAVRAGAEAAALLLAGGAWMFVKR